MLLILKTVQMLPLEKRKELIQKQGHPEFDMGP